MSQATPPNALAAQVTRLWNEPVDRPRALIFLATPGREPGNLREIAQGLGLGYIRLDLTQAVTPEQHLQLTDKSPRLLCLFGLDRLGAGERDALVRLLGNGPRTLSIIICPVAAEREDAIRSAWKELRAFERLAEERNRRRETLAGH